VRVFVRRASRYICTDCYTYSKGECTLWLEFVWQTLRPL
jgi:uncharacterized protein YbdZ (MbtH family)